jgi:hypothetical protein
MSEPTWPVITFKLNLASAQRLGWSLPNNTQPLGNETVSEASNIPNTFSSWIPGYQLANIAQLNGYTFTAYGEKAQYLKNTYANGSIDDLLIVVG